MLKMRSAGAATVLAMRTFFPRPMTNRRTPIGEVVERDDALFELIGDVAVADDRSGDELREEQQIERGMHRALLRRGVAPVDVDDVGNGVERIERDADRQQHVRKRQRLRAERGGHGVDVVGKEVRVLEDAQHHQVHRDRHAEHAPRVPRGARAVDGNGHPVVEGDRGEHQPGERSAAFRVEDDAGDEQQPVGVGGVRTTQEIQPEQDRKKEEEKSGFSKKHGGWRLGAGG